VPGADRDADLQRRIDDAARFKVLEAITDIDLADPQLMAEAGLPLSSDDSGGFRDFSAATIQRRHDAGHKLAELKLRKLFEARELLPR
jgi:hypothetical protein